VTLLSLPDDIKEIIFNMTRKVFNDKIKHLDGKIAFAPMTFTYFGEYEYTIVNKKLLYQFAYSGVEQNLRCVSYKM
jgi:hypothetical protein